jgi:hypothetical protein
MSVNLNSLDKDQLPYPRGQPIKTIKNMATNQYLSVISQPIDEETFAIRANDHCLYVYDNNDYTLKPCALTEDFVHPQYFQAKKIINDVAEARILGKKGITKSVPTPYTVFQHKATQQCLTYDTEGLYAAKCEPDNIYQKWAVSPDETICLH